MLRWRFPLPAHVQPTAPFPLAAAHRHSSRERLIRRSRLVRQLTIFVASFTAMMAGLQITKPVFMGQQRMAERLIEPAAPPVDSTVFRAPWINASAEEAIGSPQFERDRAAFVADLLGTGKLTVERADRIADAAVRQAYTERVPPALVLGVMLTENDQFKPTARSKVGAVGLMQVMPKHWRTRTLRERFGTNLRDDATNVKYGVFILGYFSRKVPDSTAQQEGWRRALLTYNGCVRGTNTPTCHRYPDVVRRHVQRRAGTLCDGRDFEDCVVRPMWLAMQARAEQRRAASKVLHGD